MKQMYGLGTLSIDIVGIAKNAMDGCRVQLLLTPKYISFVQWEQTALAWNGGNQNLKNDTTAERNNGDMYNAMK
jgi:hypothetical protein